ncbi:MAG: hypothetical protein ACRDP3_27310 [Streptomyces sp.]|uniref:hypothetical protein n=1 Tax=Streptomyces sp. TaxID=1931 RepID=UPI003D6AE3E8
MTPPETEDPRGLLAEARRLSERGHPSAPAAWQRLEEAVARTGVRLTGAERAELLDHSAMRLARTDPAAGAVGFAEAVGLFVDAGEHGQAVACRARAALAAAFAGNPDQALAQLEPLCAEAVSLHSARRAGTRHTTAVLLSRARVRFLLLDTAEDPRRAAAALDAELAELIAFAHPDRAQPAVLARIADATESRGQLAGLLDDDAAAATLFAEAAALYHESGRPWQATGAELLLAQELLRTGDAERAGSLLRGALGDPQRAALRAPEEAARLHLALADVLAAQERPVEEADQLREAAHWADTAGEAAGLGAYARLRLGGASLELDRPEEAAAVLESAMADLESRHGEGDVVQARWWLGQARSLLGDDQEAAEQFLRAAETAEVWEDQRDHAMLAHLAAEALARAGLPDQAGQAYELAEELWRSLGETCAVVKALRSRAFIAIGEDPADGAASVGAAPAAAATKAVELMAAALREVESGLRGSDDGEDRLLLRLELGLTYRQTAELLLRAADGPPDQDSGTPEQHAVNRAAYQEAVACADHAVTVFRGCGEPALHERTAAELMAARLEMDLGRRDAAARRAHLVLEAYPDGNGLADGTEGAAEAAAVATERRRGAGEVLSLLGEPAQRSEGPRV